jgi:hypothetical protein
MSRRAYTNAFLVLETIFQNCEYNTRLSCSEYLSLNKQSKCTFSESCILTLRHIERLGLECFPWLSCLRQVIGIHRYGLDCGISNSRSKLMRERVKK